MAPTGISHQTQCSALGTGPNTPSELGNLLRASRIVQEKIQVARATLPELAMPRLPRCDVRVQFCLVRAPEKNARSHGWDHRNCVAAEHAARGAAFFSDRQPGRDTTPALGATRGAMRDSVCIRKDAGAIWRRGHAEMLRRPHRNCTGAGARRGLPTRA